MFGSEWDSELARSGTVYFAGKRLSLVRTHIGTGIRCCSPWREGWLQFRAFILFLTLVGFVAWSGFWLFRHSIDQQLAEMVEQQANRVLQESGWHVRFGGAELSPDGRLNLRGVQLFQEGQAQPALTVDQLEVHFPADLSNPEAWSIRPDRVQLEESSIKLDIDQWRDPAVGRLLAAICPMRRPLPPIVPVSIRNSTLRLFHRAADRLGPMALYDFQLRAVGEDTAEESHLRVQFQGTLLESGDLSGTFDVSRCERRYAAAFEFEQVHVNEKLLELVRVPPTPTDRFSGWNGFRAALSGQLRAAGSLGPATLDTYAIEARFSEAIVSHDLLRVQLLGAQGQLIGNQDRMEFRDVSADLDNGQLRGSASWRPGNGQWETDFVWQDCRFHSGLLASWPPAVERILNEVGPSGLVDIQIQASGPNEPRLNCQLTVKQGEFLLARFPFPVSHCVGSIHLQQDECRVDIQALEAGQIVDIRGHASDLQTAPVFDFHFRCDGVLPINDKLLGALKRYPRTLRQIEMLRPRGSFGLVGNFSKPAPDQPAELNYDIFLKQCSIRHQMFEYSIRDIGGTVRVRGPIIRFDQLAGRHEQSAVRGDGDYHPDRGLTLQFTADRVALTQELRAAFQPPVRAVWDSLRPAGRVGLVQVDLLQAVAETKPRIAVEIELHDPAASEPPAASITPLAFPYEISGLRGNLRIADGIIQLRGIEGEHQRTWIAGSGQGNYDWDRWNLDFNDVLVGSLKVDEDLLAAMPRNLEEACRDLHFEGLINLAGKFSLTSQPSGEWARQPQPAVQPVAFVDLPQDLAPPGLLLDWDFRLDMDAAKMQIGFDFENINGSVRLTGQSDGEQATCAGQLNIDSLSLFNMQLTHVQGPLWIDGEKAGVGYFAGPGSGTQGQSITGQLYGGQVHLDGQTWTDGEQRFYVHATLANSQLAPLAQIWAPQMERLTGIAQGAVRVWGLNAAADSIQGEGSIQLHDAHLFELPVFLAMLRQISRPDLDSRAFDSSLAQFTIRDSQVQFERMEFIGDALSLIGNGSLNFNGNIDLNFFTVMGRNRFKIPLISEIAQASSQQILWIGVEGTLANPQTYRKILPAINEGLRRLLGLRESPRTDGDSLMRWSEAPSRLR